MSEKILSVDRALEVLLYLYKRDEEIGISEISRDLDFPKSTVHRILSTLEARGFVYKNPDTDNYWLGMTLYSLGFAVEDKISLTDIIRPYVRDLHERVNEVINVSILRPDGRGFYETVMIDKMSSNNNILSIDPKLGSISQAHISSVGKSLMAYNEDFDPSKMGDYELKSYTKNTITSWEDFGRELEEIRQRGYAIDREEQEIGLFCIGAPIFGKNKKPLAAISISGPTPRMKTKDLDNKVESLLKTVSEINKLTKDIHKIEYNW